MASIVAERAERGALIAALFENHQRPFYADEDSIAPDELRTLAIFTPRVNELKASIRELRSLITFARSPTERPADFTPELYEVKSFYDAIGWYALPALGRRLNNDAAAQMVVDALSRVDWKAYRESVADTLAASNPAMSEFIRTCTLPQLQTYVGQRQEKSVVPYTILIFSTLFNVNFFIAHANGAFEQPEKTGTTDSWIAILYKGAGGEFAVYYAKQLLSTPLPPQVAANYSLIFRYASLPPNIQDLVDELPRAPYSNPFETSPPP